MNKTKNIITITFIFLLQSCYFGAGLIEKTLVGNIHLIALNSLDEAEVIYQEKGNSVYYTLVPSTVTEVGYNKDFVIAKSHPKDSINRVNRNLTYFYIIEVNKVSEKNHQESEALTEEQFEARREQLNVPKKLKFTIDLKE